MYGKSASSGVESMNRANKIVREKTAVDMLNAAILLLQMEGNRFHQWKEKAWGRELPLTPKGMEHMEMVFKDINVREYRLTTHDDMFWHYATISKNTETAREYHVRLPKESYNGSYFGKCTCGVTSKEGIPCRHMVVLVKSSVIPTLTRTNIMPHFWSTAHWQMQYPLDLDCNTEMTIQMVKAVSRPNEFIRYCPDWSAPKKSGRPKKSDKVLTVTEIIELASSKKKRKRRPKLFCEICHKFNHTTLQCFKNPINCNLDVILEGVQHGNDEDEEGAV